MARSPNKHSKSIPSAKKPSHSSSASDASFASEPGRVRVSFGPPQPERLRVLPSMFRSDSGQRTFGPRSRQVPRGSEGMEPVRRGSDGKVNCIHEMSGSERFRSEGSMHQRSGSERFRS